ncbi:hypothetical protein DFO67_10220 [Modicisalibacter xianhensis]|uniref:Uncharacterized protein n=1 Tax=Modicisalibacter xianhensis TaxID=442341 RepID=A0A4R8G9A1_9GAMM|nr:hypothetical protein [Halomonas xianhensis]TDX32072.1 hypothetical protein DFO67_10220 [Halomonas xianhensis]
MLSNAAAVLPSESQPLPNETLNTEGLLAADGNEAWIQLPLLGRSAQRALNEVRLAEETLRASEAMLTTLDLIAPQAPHDRVRQVHSIDRCMETAAIKLRQYTLGQSLADSGFGQEGSSDGVKGVIRDFMHFTAMAQTACRLQGQPSLVLLPHLVGLAMVRYKIEALWQEESGVNSADTQYLTHEEIAAACELKLTSLRNAVSRGELPQSDGACVPIRQALDWMLVRQRFLFLRLARSLPSRHINGKMASLWLGRQPTAEAVKTVSRLRLTLWRLGAQGTLIAVNTGVRQCILTLPFAPPSLESHEIFVTDRSHDKAADLLRKGLGVSSSSPIWQVRMKSREAFEKLVAHWL